MFLRSNSLRISGIAPEITQIQLQVPLARFLYPQKNVFRRDTPILSSRTATQERRSGLRFLPHEQRRHPCPTSMSENPTTIITSAEEQETSRNGKTINLDELYVRLDHLQDALASVSETLNNIYLELKNSRGNAAEAEPGKPEAEAVTDPAAAPGSEPAPARKKRGRPKRAEAAAPEQGQDAVQPAPRRRGRPRKNPVAVEPVSETSSEPVGEPANEMDGHAASTPAAEATDSEPVAVTQDLPFVPQDEQPEDNPAGTLPYAYVDPEIPAAPKKRGRPKKHPAPDAAPTTATTGGKRRGRPRKAQAGNGETLKDATLQVISEEQNSTPDTCDVPQIAAADEPAELSVVAELDAIRDIEQDIMQRDDIETLKPENDEPGKENGIIKLDHAKRGKKRKHKKKQSGPWDQLVLGKLYDVRDAHKAIKNAEYSGTEEIGGLTLHCFKIGNELFKFSEPSLRQFSTITESEGTA